MLTISGYMSAWRFLAALGLTLIGCGASGVGEDDEGEAGRSAASATAGAVGVAGGGRGGYGGRPAQPVAGQGEAGATLAAGEGGVGGEGGAGSELGGESGRRAGGGAGAGGKSSGGAGPGGKSGTGGAQAGTGGAAPCNCFAFSACCDGCHLRPAGYACGEAEHFPSTKCVGKDVEHVYHTLTCNGSSTACTNQYGDYSRSSVETCADGSPCFTDTQPGAAPARCLPCSCTDGPCCDGCHPRPKNYECAPTVKTSDCTGASTMRHDHWTAFCDGGTTDACTLWGEHRHYTAENCETKLGPGATCVASGDDAICKL